MNIRDSLMVTMKGAPAGSLVHVLTYDSVTGIAVESNSLVLAPLKYPSLRMRMQEWRQYGKNYLLDSAWQSLDGGAGISTWALGRPNSADKRILAVGTGGKVRTTIVASVKESIYGTLVLYGKIHSQAIQKGLVVHDTSFDLTSRAVIYETITCVATAPAPHNRYVFTTTNSLSKSSDKWETDLQGHTLMQEIPPFFVACKEGFCSKSVPFFTPDFFDAARIVPKGAYRQGCRVHCRFEGGLAPDSSVALWYTGNNGEYRCTAPDSSGMVLWKTSKDSVFCVPTVTLQSDDTSLIRIAREEVAHAKDSVQHLNSWVYTRLIKKNTATFSSALETLNSGYGDCGEHAVLLAALCRAVNIPARVVYGCLYLPGKRGYYWHAWVVAKSHGMWRFADPSHNRYPAAGMLVPLLIDDSGEGLVRLGQFVGMLDIRHVR